MLKISQQTIAEQLTNGCGQISAAATGAAVAVVPVTTGGGDDDIEMIRGDAGLCNYVI